ncbi:unnamed protein product [Phyllotreta striolata]|uniref:Ras-associating domain-containing protein n=1 Tax=Phyllotreta striolata TaxID=444603 RepID=A0A9N9XKZ3_PHYSR|nr:unnamed protein product [Phyllotreta striolata]
MELKVWVEGIQRIVCGVTETTTCQDVVFALAHATGKSGRFTLIERWRNNERQLSPQENPMKIIMKWGEYSNDVQFILQRNEATKATQPAKAKSSGSSSSTPTHNSSLETPCEPQRDVHRALANNSYLSNYENVGIVKGIPQIKPVSLEVRESLSNSNSLHSSPKRFNYSMSGSDISDSSSQRIAPPYKDPPAPPPYRDPPQPSSAIYHDKFKRDQSKKDKDENRNKIQDNILYNAQYRELVALISYQRDKLSTQQADMHKYDAEIVFLENKEREKQRQLDFIAQEILAITNVSKNNQEQMQALCYVEEESEIVKQQEKTLQSEITLLRSKLANCETELLQCKNKIRLLMDEVQMEQRAQSRRQESLKQLERNILLEVDRLQKDIELAKQSAELHHLTAETLKCERTNLQVTSLETAIVEKKRQVERLVQEMKEANLESLSIVPPEDVRQILEGPAKSGSTRRMIGSPRQLENAVPTNKNPHGVWV